MLMVEIRILLVEDNPGDAKLIREGLRSQGFGHFDIHEAATLRGALNCLLELEVDLVLLDLHLPDASGLETLRRVYEAAPHLPIVVLTGQEDEALGIEAVQEGAEDYLVKGGAGGPVIARAARYAVERRLSRLALRRSEDRYRLMVETAEEGVWVIDDAERTTFVNRKMAELLGYLPSEMIGRSLFDFMSDRQHAAAQSNLERRRRGIREVHDFALRRKDGSEFWALCATSPIFGAGGKYEGALAMVTDITERRRAEEELTRMAAIIDTSEDAILSKSLDGIILTWNEGATRLYGYSRQEAVGRHVSMLVPDDRRDELDAVLKRLAAGERIPSFETVRIRNNGTLVDVSLSISPVRSSEGTLIGASSIARDISERRKLELQLRQAQKMEAVGRLAGGIAHDFNNLLTVINGYSSMILERTDRSNETYSDAADIRKAGESATALTRQLLAFSRKQILAPRVLSLNDLLSGIETMLRRVLEERIELRFELDAQLGNVRIDTGQMEQVLVNLLVNARDAMPAGGTVTVETKNVLVDAPRGAQGSLRPGSYVRLTVRDRGTGMSPEALAHLFEPFFTTKAPGKGTGLGLATVYGIIRQSGGHVTVESVPQQGTAVHIDLPRVDEEAEVHPAVVFTDSMGGRESILLVEDDASVRHFTARLLDQAGYRVTIAADRKSALEIFDCVGDSIQLLLSDIVMPGMSALDLSSRVLARKPAIKILYMSGYNDDELLRERLSREHVIQKPFTASDLLRRVRAVLDETSEIRTAPPGTHFVAFFADERSRARGIARFVAHGVDAGESIVVIATRPHAVATAQELQSAGHDPAPLISQNRLFVLDAEETLARIQSLGIQAVIRPVLTTAGAGGRPIRAYGEMVDLLWRRGDARGAVALETAWNALMREEGFTLLCGYSASARDRAEFRTCHSRVLES